MGAAEAGGWGKVQGPWEAAAQQVLPAPCPTDRSPGKGTALKNKLTAHTDLQRKLRLTTLVQNKDWDCSFLKPNQPKKHQKELGHMTPSHWPF